MNKKVLTLCAGFLLAGSLATLDAKITSVKTADVKIGTSYVLGTSINATQGTMDLVKADLSVKTGASVNQLGLEWTLEQVLNEDEQFYVVSPDGKYLISAPGSGVSALGGKENAIVFEFDKSKRAIVVSDPQENWVAGYYLCTSGGTMCAASFDKGNKEQTNAPSIKYATYEVAADINDNKLISSIGSDYYFIAQTDANSTSTNPQVLGSNGTLVPAPATGLNDYDEYLWKVVSTAKAENGITYVFENKKTKKQFSYVSEEEYNKGFNLLGSTFNGNATALYHSPEVNYTVDELNKLLNHGFEMTIKKSKDDTSVIDGVSVFNGKLQAIGTGTTFQLMNGKDYIVLNKKATWDAGNVGTDNRGYKFELISKEELTGENKDNYYSTFSFTYHDGAADAKLLNNIYVYENDGKEFGKLFIQTWNKENRLTISNKKGDNETWPYIYLDGSNVYAVTNLLGKYWKIAYADSKVNANRQGATDPQGIYNEGYKYEGVLAVKATNPYSSEANYVPASGVYAKAPETHWYVADANLDNNTVTLANREYPGIKLNEVQFRVLDNGKYEIVSYEENTYGYPTWSAQLLTEDVITLTEVKDPSNFDGFMQKTENALRNETYHLGQYHAIAGNNHVYFTENHGDSHKLGVTTDKDNATKWNLKLKQKTVRVNGENVQVVDTAYIEQVFATLVDGKIVTDRKNAKVKKDSLAILPYQFQNRSNSEYMIYNPATGYEFFACDENKDDRENAAYFALKMKADSTYNIVYLPSFRNENPAKPEMLSSLNDWGKIYVANSEIDGFGALKQMNTYAEDNNSLMVVEKIDAPEYHLITNHAWGDTIRLFRGDNDSQVLYEKKDTKSVVAGDTLSFLNVDNTNQFNVNPSMFADTAYVNRWDADGIKNTCYQYLLAVQPEFGYHVDNCNNPAHKPDVTNQIDTVYGRFLVNLIDTANMYGLNNIHNNPYIIESAAGDPYAKLAFVEGFHTNDTLYIARENADTVKLAMDTPDFNVAKFAFRYVDDQAKTFKIQTQYKEYVGDNTAFATEEDVAEWYEDNSSWAISNEGYLRWVNGTIAVVKGWENGEVFSIEEGVDATPTANEEISAEEATVSVVATDGAVIVKGAEGKNVVVSTILGKVVANEVLNSDNETIAAPAGIVVVSVDGESFKVAVK